MLELQGKSDTTIVIDYLLINLAKNKPLFQIIQMKKNVTDPF